MSASGNRAVSSVSDVKIDVHSATFNGRKREIEELIKTQALTTVNDGGESVLHVCVRSPVSDISVFELLLKSLQKEGKLEEILHKRDKAGNTVAHHIARRRKHDFLHVLENITAKLYEVDGVEHTDGTPLHIAASNGDVTMFWKYFDVFNKLEKDKKSKVLRMRRGDGNTLLHICARQAHGDLLQALLKAGSSLERTNASGNTVLHDLAWQMSIKSVSSKQILRNYELIMRHADHWFSEAHPEMVVHQNSSSGDPNMKAVRYLLECITNKEGYSVLQYINALCVPKLMLYIYSLENVYKFYDGDMCIFDVTNLTPETAAHDMKPRTNELMRGYQNDRNNKEKQEANQSEPSNTSNLHPIPDHALGSGIDDTIKGQLDEQVTQQNRQDKEPLNDSHSGAFKRKAPPEKPKCPNSLLEILIKSKDKDGATLMLDASPIKYLVQEYRAIYKLFYVVAGIIHVIHMSLYSQFAPKNLQKLWIHDLNDSNPKPSKNETHANLFLIWPVLTALYSIIYICLIFAAACRFAKDPDQSYTPEPNISTNTTLGRLLRKRTIKRVALFLYKLGYSLANSFSLAFALLFSVSTFVWYVFYLEDDRRQLLVAAAVLICGWLQTIYFLRVFETIHIFLVMVNYMMFRDVLFIVTISCFIYVGFASMIYTFIQVSNELIDQNPVFNDAAFLIFNFMLGTKLIYKNERISKEAFDEVSFNTGYLTAGYVIYMILTTVLFINLLIAMMSDTYADVRNREGTHWRVETIADALSLENKLLPSSVANFAKQSRLALLDHEVRCENDRRLLYISRDKVDLKVPVFSKYSAVSLKRQ